MTKLWGISKQPMWVAVVTSLAVLLSGGAAAAQAEECVSPSPREVPVKIVNIYNNSTIPIYAVLETAKQIQPDPDNQNRPHDRWLQAEFNPTPGTYASTYLYRTYVNPKNGILPRSSVSVTVPFYTQLTASPCPFAPDQYINWWRALRIHIYDDPGAIKHAYDGDQQNAVLIWPPGGIPSCPKCASPLVVYQDHSGGDGHGLSLPSNDPSQLLEFTFASVDPPPLPLKIDYDFVDYDISSVDQVYLPVAMDPVGNPYIGYVGSVLELGSVLGGDGFRGRLSQFQKDFGWPKYKWPSYVTNQGNLRLPGTYNVMNEIANPGAPPPFVPAGQDIKQLPVVQAMEKLWDDCCGTGWPAGSCQKPSPPEALCDNMAKVADLFEKNYANYTRVCANPKALNRDLMLAHVYGWAAFNEGCGLLNRLEDTPGFDLPAYLAVFNTYIGLQYRSRPDSTTFGEFNRYVELIHSPKYLRVGEYAFSIDDAAGNMFELGAGINITVAGAKGLSNSNPYDPWRFFMFNLGAADEGGLRWKKYRICTANDAPSCPSTAPDRTVKVAAVKDGKEQYAGIKIGAVNCPCTIVLQDSAGSLYKVQVNSLPAPPPVHRIDEEGDAPTSDDALWTKTLEDRTYANALCADADTSFAFCKSIQPAKVSDTATQQTVYHVNTGPPVVPQPGVRFGPGNIVGNLSNDRASVTVTWPKATTQPAGRTVKYELTLWNRANCPRDSEPCTHHASIPLLGTCNDAATQCKVVLAKTVPPLTADTLKSMSVVAKDPDGHIDAKEANFVPAGTAEIRSGTANGVGEGSAKGDVRISAVFTSSGPLDLAARGAKVRVRSGLNETGGAGELVLLQGPLTLAADARNTPETARFDSAAGKAPATTVTIGSQGRGQYTLSLAMSNATIALPGGCPKPALTTSIEVNDGRNPPVVLDVKQPWTCVKRSQRVIYLTTP